MPSFVHGSKSYTTLLVRRKYSLGFFPSKVESHLHNITTSQPGVKGPGFIGLTHELNKGRIKLGNRYLRGI